jgi:hypothetical protein
MTFVYRARVLFTGGTGGAQVATMHFRNDTGLTAQYASDAIGDFFSAMKTKISSAYTISADTEVLTIDVATGLTTAAATVTPRSFNGEDSSDPLPWQTQGLCKFPTGFFLAGRRLQGRVFIPGPTEASNTNGVPSSAYVTAVQSAVDTLTGWTNADLVVYSAVHHAAISVPAGAAATRWASLRSRRD